MILVTLFKSIILLVLFGLAQSGLINHVHHRTREISNNCEHVRHLFKPYLHIRHSNSNAHSLANICPGVSSSSCCHGLELAIERKTRETFHDSIKKHISTFHNQFEQHSNVVKQHVFSILNNTLNKIKVSGDEHAMQRTIKAAESIFDGIKKNFIQISQNRFNKPVSSLELEDAASGFIKAIIIDILEKDYGKKFTFDFLDCLNQIDFEAFNNLNKLTEKMHRSLHLAFETSSIVFQSVGHFETLLNRSLGVQLTEKCVRQLAGDLHCGSCEHSNPKQYTVCGSTCRRALHTGECLNSGVLPWVGESWKKMVETFNQFIVLGFLNERNPENSFSEFATIVSKAIHEAHDIKVDIKNMAELSCGNPSRSYRSVNQGSSIASQMPEHKSGLTVSSSSSSPSASSLTSNERRNEQFIQFGQDLKPSLFVSVESLNQILVANKNLFTNLTDKICLEFDDKQCSSHHVPPTVSVVSQTSAIKNSHRQNSDNKKDDEYHELISRFQIALEKHHKMISNSTKYSMILEGEESAHHFITDGSGSGSYPSSDTEPDDVEPEDEVLEGSANNPNNIDPTTSTPSTTTDIIFSLPGDPEISREDSTGAGAANVRFSITLILFIPFLVILLNRRHC